MLEGERGGGGINTKVFASGAFGRGIVCQLGFSDEECIEVGPGGDSSGVEAFRRGGGC